MEKMMEAYKPTHKPMVTRATVPHKDPILFNTTTPTRTQHEPTHETTSPNPPSTPSPKQFNHQLSHSIVQDFTTSVILPPIHLGIYPSTTTPSQMPPNNNIPHQIHSQLVPNQIHTDFRHISDLIDYEELCYTVNSQLNYDRQHPPPPIKKSSFNSCTTTTTNTTPSIHASILQSTCRSKLNQ